MTRALTGPQAAVLSALVNICQGDKRMDWVAADDISVAAYGDPKRTGSVTQAITALVRDGLVVSRSFGTTQRNRHHVVYKPTLRGRYAAFDQEASR